MVGFCIPGQTSTSLRESRGNLFPGVLQLTGSRSGSSVLTGKVKGYEMVRPATFEPACNPLAQAKLPRTTGAGSYNDAYLAAAALLVVTSALTFVTRMLEKKHKTQFGV